MNERDEALIQEIVGERYVAAWWYAAGRLDEAGVDIGYKPQLFAAMARREAHDYHSGRASSLPSIMNQWKRFMEGEGR